jgi:cytochrome P450
VRGVRIARGESVTLFFNSANRDETVFDDPFAFRIDRKPNPQLAAVEVAGPVRGIESNFTGGLKSLPLRIKWQ